MWGLAWGCLGPPTLPVGCTGVCGHTVRCPLNPLAAALLLLTQPSCRLQAVQEEAAKLFAQLRSKMVAVPRGQKQQQRQLQEGQAGGGQSAKRPKSVTFQQRAVSAA